MQGLMEVLTITVAQRLPGIIKPSESDVCFLPQREGGRRLCHFPLSFSSSFLLMLLPLGRETSHHFLLLSIQHHEVQGANRLQRRTCSSADVTPLWAVSVQPCLLHMFAFCWSTSEFESRQFLGSSLWSYINW